MNPLAVILIVGGGLVFIWAIAIYNRLVRLRQHVRESWSGIDVQLKRRHDLIPNLVATVKGYAAHESNVLEKVTRLRAEAVRGVTSPRGSSASEGPLAAGLAALFAVAERYPALRADAHFLALQKELAETEDRIAAARRFFNGNVRDLNSLCEQFPSALVANAAGVRPVDFFELESAAERVVPRVAPGTQPGGQVSWRRARRWTWRWGTVSQASGPWLMTSRKPRASCSFLATTPAVSRRCPRTASSEAVASPTRGITFFGMMSRWTGAAGAMSWMTMQRSSSCSILAGISRSMMRWKRVFDMGNFYVEIRKSGIGKSGRGL